MMNKLGLALLIHLILSILIQTSDLGYTLSITLSTGILFFCQSNYTGHPTPDWKSPKNTTVSTLGGKAQTWDGFRWPTPVNRHVSTQAPLCWEQKNPSKQEDPNYTSYRGRLSLELCRHSVTLKDSDWFVTDGSCCPGIYRQP